MFIFLNSLRPSDAKLYIMYPLPTSVAIECVTEVIFINACNQMLRNLRRNTSGGVSNSHNIDRHNVIWPLDNTQDVFASKHTSTVTSLTPGEVNMSH